MFSQHSLNSNSLIHRLLKTRDIANLSVEGKTSYWNIRIYQDQLGYLFVYMCVCCVVIQVGVLDTGRGSRLVIR